MVILERVAEVRAVSRAAKARGERVGLVPTMGYLHEGHLSLVRRARELSGFVVVSIFVNPAQFGPGEDLESYPRDPDNDSSLCRAEGVDVIFVPPGVEIYPPGYQTAVTVEELSKPLCGASRPHHFRGVATVVAKLFNMVEPDVAVFGEKDYQQLLVVRRMVRDLNMDVEVAGAPIVRAPDGLALSSRNAHLSEAEREQALALSAALERAQELVNAGEHRADALVLSARQILAGAGVRIDYIELRDPESLGPLDEIRERAVLALAAFVGQTRLIDNRVLVREVGDGRT